MLVFKEGFSFPLDKTSYARLWDDYQVLLSNANSVIIHRGIAVRWRKKGKPPEEMTLCHFATKYKQQPLIGVKEDVECFLSSLNHLIAQAIEESQMKKAAVSAEIGMAEKSG